MLAMKTISTVAGVTKRYITLKKWSNFLYLNPYISNILSRNLSIPAEMKITTNYEFP